MGKAQAKTELLDYHQIVDIDTSMAVYGFLYELGYRGLLNTAGDDVRLEMTLPGALPVAASTGAVVLYAVQPTVVRGVITAAEFDANYDITDPEQAET